MRQAVYDGFIRILHARIVRTEQLDEISYPWANLNGAARDRRRIEESTRGGTLGAWAISKPEFIG